jgi:curli biogenesis system outer membrane secretion channel CsgG
MKKIISKSIYAFLIIFLVGCSAKQKVVQTQSQVEPVPTEEEPVLKRKVAIARFTNETQYAKGIFYEKENDPIQKQAADILATKLVQSGKFILLERQDFEAIEKEMDIADIDFEKVGADYLIMGSVTEFGRKNIGDVNAFSRSKSQVVHAAVSLRLVDVSTGQIIYSEEAQGESETTTKTVMGLGERADYDASLNDKAISVAISKLVENVINNCMDRPWKSYFLSAEDGSYIISGGESQGIKAGDQFNVVEKGKKVKNPQTGMMIELPGKTVGKVKVTLTGGDTPQSEYSIVSFTEGSIDKENLNKYYIKEISNENN